MEIVAAVLIILEMIIVNLINVDTYSKRKYSVFFTIFVQAVFTIVLLVGFILLSGKDVRKSDGNGIFILLGSFYLIPIKFLYDTPLKKIMIVLYTSWVYTALAFVFGVHFAYLFSGGNFIYLALLFQTIIYIPTLLIFTKIIKKNYKLIIENMTESIINKYLIVSLSTYISIISINYALVTKSLIASFLSFIFLGVTCTYLFYFVFSLIKEKKSNEELNTKTLRDSLTGVPNRNALLKVFEHYLADFKVFSLTFIDLDHFKRINDNYGHNVGDEYIKKFSSIITKLFRGHGDLFRLYGDEFVILSPENAIFMDVILKDSLNALKNQITNPSFIGFSYGIVEVKEKQLSLDEYLKRADEILYQHKTKMHEIEEKELEYIKK